MNRDPGVKNLEAFLLATPIRFHENVKIDLLYDSIFLSIFFLPIKDGWIERKSCHGKVAWSIRDLSDPWWSHVIIYKIASPRTLLIRLFSTLACLLKQFYPSFHLDAVFTSPHHLSSFHSKTKPRRTCSLWLNTNSHVLASKEHSFGHFRLALFLEDISIIYETTRLFGFPPRKVYSPATTYPSWASLIVTNLLFLIFLSSM